MRCLTDLDLGKLCQLKNTLLERTDSTAPSSYYSTLTDSNIGLLCHYNGRIWYYGKTLSGNAAWYSVGNATYDTANRVLITDSTSTGVASTEWGVTDYNLDLGVSGTKRRIVNLAAPMGPYDATNKNYVDTLAALLPSGTEGQTLYNNAGNWTANSNLFWDDTNNQLGVGISSSLLGRIHSKGSGNTSATYSLYLTNSDAYKTFSVNDVGTAYIQSRQTVVGYGTELITNGGFTTNLDNWTIGSTGAGWVYSSGKASHNTGNTDTFSQVPTIAASTHYRLAFTLVKTAGTSLTVTLGGITVHTQTSNTAGATYTYDVLTTTTAGITFTPTSDYAGTIDDVTVKIYTTPIAPYIIFEGASGANCGAIRCGETNTSISIGYNALAYMDTDSYQNTAFGVNALSSMYYGTRNTAVGYQAGRQLNNSNNNTLIGVNTAQAIFVNSSHNTMIGGFAGYTQTTANYNTAVGAYSMFSNTTGTGITCLGYSALYACYGNYNTSTGYAAAQSVTSGVSNTAFGALCLNAVTTGGYNTSMGYGAMTYPYTSSEYNCAFGYKALYGVSTNICSYNNALGGFSLYAITTGAYNNGMGYQALYNISSGSYNIALGHQTGLAVTSGSSNLIIGDRADVVSGTTSNQMSIGNAIYGVSIDGTTSTISTGRIGLFVKAPTAKLHLIAGTTAASTAPLKFTSGSLLTAAEAGTIEFLTDKFYGGITTGPAQKEFTLNDKALTSGRVPYLTTNGRLTDASTFTYDGTYLTVQLPNPSGDTYAVNRGYILSRGENLITNGSGLLGTNYNFSAFTFDAAQTYGGGGSFKHDGVYVTAKYTDEYIPIDPSRTYRLNMWARSGEDGGTNYNAANTSILGVVCYDIDYAAIQPYHFFKYAGSTDTTLAQNLNPGDDHIHVTDATGWYNGATTYTRNFAWYPYTNSKGYSYPTYTYTRYVSNSYSSNNSLGCWAEGGISGNTITIRAAGGWAGPALTAGTAIRNNNSGNSAQYCIGTKTVPNSWTYYEGAMTGLNTTSASSETLFCPGTAFIKLIFLPNYTNGTGNIVRYSNIWLSEVSCNNLEAASATQIGVVNLTTQTLGAGAKTFGSTVAMTGLQIMYGATQLGKFNHDNTNVFLGAQANCIVNLQTNNATRWQITAAGHILPAATNTYDIGSSSYYVQNSYIKNLTISALLNLPTSQPTGAVTGSCYWDDSAGKLWVYASGGWRYASTLT